MLLECEIEQHLEALTMALQLVLVEEQACEDRMIAHEWVCPRTVQNAEEKREIRQTYFCDGTSFLSR